MNEFVGKWRIRGFVPIPSKQCCESTLLKVQINFLYNKIGVTCSLDKFGQKVQVSSRFYFLTCILSILFWSLLPQTSHKTELVKGPFSYLNSPLLR